jgi:3-carboxy-cis,cis-muconate cycloisomerase
MAEHVTTVLTPELGRLKAHELVKAACERVAESGTNNTGLKQELMSEPAISQSISGEELDAALDPGGYLGSTEIFIDRALAFYQEEEDA